jgi:orotidine-5'-phosphate decarboxylase
MENENKPENVCPQYNKPAKTPEIIVALDTRDLDFIKKLIDDLDKDITYYKVGLESFVYFGHKIIEIIKSKGKKIFLDLKFHDIPNTVSNSTISAAELGIDMVNLHCQGGLQMLKMASETLSEFCYKKNVAKPLLIGVTLLTSLDSNYLKEMKIGYKSELDYVLYLSEIAKKAKLDGVVSSALETRQIKEQLGENFLTITPGIRPKFASNDDQKRVVTPIDAVNMKTDFIVIGRPITKHNNPKYAVKLIKEEMSI